MDAIIKSESVTAHLYRLRSKMMSQRTFDYPIWGTQGGGLVREVRGVYIFVEKPNCPGFDVGDVMPSEWGIVPANNLAHHEDEQEELAINGIWLDGWTVDLFLCEDGQLGITVHDKDGDANDPNTGCVDVFVHEDHSVIYG